MRVDPALKAFAADAPAQAAAQDRVLAARDDWKKMPRVAAILRDCAAYSAGEKLADCERLASLISGEGTVAFVHDWMDVMLAAWREAPLAQMPFRHSYSGGTGALHLHQEGRVTLALLVMETSAPVTPTTMAFTDCERHEVVLAGRGRGMAFRKRSDAPPTARALDLLPGSRFHGDADNARAIAALDTPLVLLRLARDPAVPRPTCEIDVATGEVVHRASGTAADGRAELAAALLGAMGRGDAAPALARFACGQGGEGARWQALRHALALDTSAGFTALRDLADRQADPIAADASTLLDRLCTSYPQLANMRGTSCHAS